MPPYLESMNGPSARRRFPLTKPESTIGREPTCDVFVELPAVSRVHARIHIRGDKAFIEDRESRNNTYLNRKEIKGKGECPLKDGDRIGICESLFVYRSGEPLPESSIAQEEESGSTIVNTVDAASNADVFAQQNSESKLKAILEISRELSATLDLNLLFPKILDALFRIFPQADRGLIILIEGKDELIPKAAKHRRQDQDTIRFSKTVVNQAINQKKALLSSNTSADERFQMSQSIADFKIRSVVCVPLLTPAEQACLGVILLDSQSLYQRFTPEDMELLVGVGSQIASAIDNARSHEDILKKEKLDRELMLARDIQQGFLPRSLPPRNGYQFSAYYQAAGQVGGDYYDLIALPNNSMAVLLGDVSGKGVPAALFMAKVTSDARVSLISKPDDPAAAMENINNLVCAASLADKFMTLILCLLDPSKHQMTIVNAGHMSPVVRRANGKVEEPATSDQTGLPIGVMDEIVYSSITIDLAVGDTVVLYSDGISEAMDVVRNLYSIERLRECVSKDFSSPNELVDCIIADVEKHVNGFEQSDDMTLMVFKRME